MAIDVWKYDDKCKIIIYNLTDITTSNSCRSDSTFIKIHHEVPKITVPSIEIEFHVVLSKEEWLWDSSAKAYICFSDARLGGFFVGHGPMEEK